MSAVWMRLHAEIRSHLMATLALVVLVGIAGGVVLAAGAGARRTDTAFPRFLEASNAGDILISPQANYARVRATPLILAGLIAIIAAAMIGHALVTSVRRRRHDIAILKTLGFVQRQVSATIAWQATTFAAIALLVGIQIGVAVGRWVWTAFADQLGVSPEPVVGLPAILVAVPAALLLANLIAAVPGRIASRMQPAVVLRTE